MTKNKLTRKICKDALLRLVKGDLHFNTVILAVMLFIFVPLGLMGLYVAKYVLVLGIILSLVCAVFPIVFICKLAYSIYIVRLVKQDGFSIVKDTVCNMSKGELVSRYKTANVIYFTEYGRYVPAGSTYDMTSVKDEFYIVVLNVKKKEPLMVYHTMMYEFSETDI